MLDALGTALSLTPRFSAVISAPREDSRFNGFSANVPFSRVSIHRHGPLRPLPAPEFGRQPAPTAPAYTPSPPREERAGERRPLSIGHPNSGPVGLRPLPCPAATAVTGNRGAFGLRRMPPLSWALSPPIASRSIPARTPTLRNSMSENGEQPSRIHDRLTA
jgi:hypothetical protein